MTPERQVQVETEVKVVTSEKQLSRLQALGLTNAARRLSTAKSLSEKCKVAYTHYRFIEPEQIQVFQEKLKQERKGNAYKKLIFTDLEKYPHVPPDHALDALEIAKGLQCFDSFAVAHVEYVEPVPDPLLLAKIDGCPDYFFLAQWDDDVKIEDILQADQGIVKKGFEL